MRFIDVETCGLHGMPVLLQYADDDGPVRLYDIWGEPVGRTLALLHDTSRRDVCGFNLAFDWFHLCKLFTTWRLLPRGWIPIEHIDAIAHAERGAWRGPCLKPARACDLMLHARKGPLQALMARKRPRIRRVPASLAPALVDQLERIQLDGIYFAGNAPDAPRWKIHADGELADIELAFAPEGGLKYIAEHVLKRPPRPHFGDVCALPQPTELGYAPTSAHSNWPELIAEHVEHWATNEAARAYARDDVDDTRALFGHWSPAVGDDDSELACMVAAVRWRGMAIDCDALAALRVKARAVADACPINVNATRQVREYLYAVCDETERLAVDALGINESVKAGNLLKLIGEWREHAAGARAREIVRTKAALKEIELFDKLLLAGRLHPSFVVIGAKSDRMSGGGAGLNVQGIKRSSEVRRAFPLADPGYTLSGGDFESFEVAIMDAVYKCPALHAVLTGPQKIHALMAQELYGLTYDEVMATKGSRDFDGDKYNNGKRAVFGLAYFGEVGTLRTHLGIPQERAERAFKWWLQFAGVNENRQSIVDAHTAVRQPRGVGTAVEWREPAEYVESFLGFRRYFTLEIAICRELYRLANNIPGEWRVGHAVKRRQRWQTPGGAVQSALYSAAAQVSGAMVRAAGNHKIQSPGGQITKHVQRRVWDLQPAGVAEFRVLPLNVHDEIMCPTTIPAVVRARVAETVAEYRDRVPLIAIDWSDNLASWGEK